ncbi:hypothetical protein N8J89_16570 [Crossiella sp. CA-258035]|uniref:hypothetical protein n=1 Tax=Crossiella sp. CA-258035 TaxID=2981138 RepID=UPI0024BD1B20|nr:hypothetical protein [Crossiella sp. CA-258035]WHT22612.1 hypothetical protein N8J89_16570 [Crossiella sp. CA-258035]
MSRKPVSSWTHPAATIPREDGPKPALSRCVERDLTELTELDTVVRSAANLLRQAQEEPARAREEIRVLWESAVAARNRATPYRLMLLRIRAVLRATHGSTPATSTAATVHSVLHGSIRPTAMDPNILTRPPLRFPASLGVRHGALAELLRTTENLADALWATAHRSRVDFAEDLDQLRTWLAWVPELRAPDRLVPVPGSAPGTYLVHRHPRPVRPRTLDPAVAVVEHEVLTARQLKLLHTAIWRGLSVRQASGMASTGERPLAVESAAAAAVRCGAWLRRAGACAGSGTRRFWPPAVGPWSTWLAATPPRQHRDLRAFAMHCTPELGGWYQILCGDIPDLRGLVRMRRPHYQALATHVAGGELLSDFAELHGRRYGEVVRAWDRMTGFAAELRARRRRVLNAVETWPSHYTGTVARLVQRVRAGLAGLGYDAEEVLGAAYGRLCTAEEDEVAEAFQALTAVLADYRDVVRRRRTLVDPADWGDPEFTLFQQQFPEIAPSGFGTPRSRTRAVEAIRAEVRRLFAGRYPTLPETERALLIELHREFSRAMREQRSPELQPYWRLWLTPGAPDEHVWRAFLEWPELVTLAATSS